MLVLAVGIRGIVILVAKKETVGEPVIVSTSIDNFVLIEGDTLAA